MRRTRRYLASIAISCALVLLAHPPTAQAQKIEQLDAGDYALSLPWDGIERTFILHVPPQYDSAAALPLLLLLHGGFGSGQQAANTAAMSAKADAEGFLSVYPDGTGVVRTWNGYHCCGPALASGVDDAGFLRLLIELFAEALKVERARIYVAGHSNGAIMAYRMAIEHGDAIAAIAVVAGAVTGQASPDAPFIVPPPPVAPVSVKIIQGWRDENVPFWGGLGASGVTDAVHVPTLDSYFHFVAVDGATQPPEAALTADGLIYRIRSGGGAGGTEVELDVALAEQHSWPGGNLDPEPSGVNATDLIWSFLERQRKAP